MRALHFLPSSVAPSYMCSIPNAADVMKSGIDTLNLLAGLQEDEKELGGHRSPVSISFFPFSSQ